MHYTIPDDRLLPDKQPLHRVSAEKTVDGKIGRAVEARRDAEGGLNKFDEREDRPRGRGRIDGEGKAIGLEKVRMSGFPGKKSRYRQSRKEVSAVGPLLTIYIRGRSALSESSAFG